MLPSRSVPEWRAFTGPGVTVTVGRTLGLRVKQSLPSILLARFSLDSCEKKEKKEFS